MLFAKACDDKEIGVYIEGVYFGGVGATTTEADAIAKYCVNNTRGGSAIPKILPMSDGQGLLEIFGIAKERFDKMERQMFDTEAILEANQARTKNKRHSK